jgi:preprotein translocase subunit SecG
MFNVIALVLCVLSSLFLIVFILLHSGKGSGLSDMFGGTSSLSGGTALERRLDKITVVTGPDLRRVDVLALVEVGRLTGALGSGC